METFYYWPMNLHQYVGLQFGEISDSFSITVQSSDTETITVRHSFETTDALARYDGGEETETKFIFYDVVISDDTVWDEDGPSA